MWLSFLQIGIGEETERRCLFRCDFSDIFLTIWIGFLQSGKSDILSSAEAEAPSIIGYKVVLVVVVIGDGLISIRFIKAYGPSDSLLL